MANSPDASAKRYLPLFNVQSSFVILRNGHPPPFSRGASNQLAAAGDLGRKIFPADDANRKSRRRNQPDPRVQERVSLKFSIVALSAHWEAFAAGEIKSADGWIVDDFSDTPLL
jgi:hypothetical protein